jgi:hypothetical protein
LGVLLFLPLFVAIALAAPTCKRGGGMGGPGYGELINNLVTLLFIVGIVFAIAGVSLLFGGTKR